MFISFKKYFFVFLLSKISLFNCFVAYNSFEPFFVVKRDGERDLNIRMTDYLDTIGEQDKLIDIEDISLLNTFKWDYERIGKRLEPFIKASKEYIKEALKENTI